MYVLTSVPWKTSSSIAQFAKPSFSAKPGQSTTAEVWPEDREETLLLQEGKDTIPSSAKCFATVRHSSRLLSKENDGKKTYRGCGADLATAATPGSTHQLLLPPRFKPDVIISRRNKSILIPEGIS